MFIEKCAGRRSVAPEERDVVLAWEPELVADISLLRSLEAFLSHPTYKHPTPSGAKRTGWSPRVIMSNGQGIANRRTTEEQNQAIEFAETSGFTPYCC
jgi:hypothetical protein